MTCTTKSRRRPFRVAALTIAVAVGIAVLGVAVAEARVGWAARGAVYRDIDAVPPRRVAIIFGAQVLPPGRPSAALAGRLDAGIALYRAGKVGRLLMTGDGRTEGYNEPAAMRAYAIARGVPADAILTDPAGLRTYDSCYRARAVYGIGPDEAIVVTQEYHLPRAIYTCDGLGVRAPGYVAAPFHGPRARDAEIREHPARWLAWWQITITRPTPPQGQ